MLLLLNTFQVGMHEIFIIHFRVSIDAYFMPLYHYMKCFHRLNLAFHVHIVKLCIASPPNVPFNSFLGVIYTKFYLLLYPDLDD